MPGTIKNATWNKNCRLFVRLLPDMKKNTNRLVNKCKNMMNTFNCCSRNIEITLI